MDYQVAIIGGGPAGYTAAEAAAPELPQLSVEEERGLGELLANVPEELRASVSQAVRVSMRAEKRRNS